MKFNFQRDPAKFAEALPPRPDRAKVVLGLDLGTNCGYCYALCRPGKKPAILPAHMGQWNLSAGQYDSGAIRFLRLRHFLEVVQPDLVAYEDVKFDPPQGLSASQAIARVATASELLGSFKATVCTWCEEHAVPCTGFKISQIKNRATGSGRADKAGIIAACNREFGTDFSADSLNSTGVDNVADAAFVCLMAVEENADGFGWVEGGSKR